MNHSNNEKMLIYFQIKMCNMKGNLGGYVSLHPLPLAALVVKLYCWSSLGKQLQNILKMVHCSPCVMKGMNIQVVDEMIIGFWRLFSLNVIVVAFIQANSEYSITFMTCTMQIQVEHRFSHTLGSSAFLDYPFFCMNNRGHVRMKRQCTTG